MKHTHSDQLERWLGKEAVARVSEKMKDFYWPIAMHGVPGTVYAMPGGDFTGEIRAGSEASSVDKAVDMINAYHRERRAAIAQQKTWHRRNLGQRNLDKREFAFASLSAIVTAQTGGKGQFLAFQKAGTAPTAIAAATDLWGVGNQPAAGAAGAAAAAGTAFTNASTGALGFANPVTTNTGHFTTGYVTSSVVSNTLLLCDRLFGVAKTMSSLATEAVTGTFSRYQNTTATAADYIGGNFCYPRASALLASVAHNWTVCQYTDQGNNATQSFASTAGVSACAANQIDLAVGNWFLPLAAGDVGVKALSQMQCSVNTLTGTLDFIVAHPIAFFPCPVANLVCPMDGIYTAFNLQYIFDNAALYFMEMPKPATTATTYSGMIQLVAE